MSESRDLLVATAEKLFAAPDLTWAQIAEAGFPLLLTPEADGGFGGDFGDAFAVLRLAGFHAVAQPLAETLTAAAAANAAGLPAVEAIETFALKVDGRIEDGRFRGRLAGAPWGAAADSLLFALDGAVWRIATSDAEAIHATANPAGEPRCEIVFDQAPVQQGDGVDLLALAAFARTAQMAGALDAALDQSVAYANDRVQFGRPIGKFQAVQQSLAVFAEEAAAVNAAGQAAARALDRGDAGLEIAAAKFIANRAADVGAATAHQVHGAIGFTAEYPLHPFTRRMVSWRSECGSDAFWAERLGRQAAAIGADVLWATLARRSDPVA